MEAIDISVLFVELSRMVGKQRRLLLLCNRINRMMLHSVRVFVSNMII